jgi:hypothetical protein
LFSGRFTGAKLCTTGSVWEENEEAIFEAAGFGPLERVAKFHVVTSFLCVVKDNFCDCGHSVVFDVRWPSQMFIFLGDMCSWKREKNCVSRSPPGLVSCSV